MILLLLEFTIKEEVLDLYIPLALPILPLLLWFRKRTKIIALGKRNNDPRFGLQIIAWLTISISLFVAQSFMETATGKLTLLQNIEQITKQPITKYYSLKQYYLEKNKFAVNASSLVSGKNSQDLNFYMHLLVPIRIANYDTTANVKAWYGMKFVKTISNNASVDEKQTAWEQFIKQSQSDFEASNLNNFDYFENLGVNDDRTKYEQALRRSDIEPGNTCLILLPKQGVFEERNGNKLLWIFGSLAIGSIVFFIVLLLLKIDETELDKFNVGSPNKEDDFKAYFAFIIPNKLHFITPILICLNILIFLLMVFNGLGFLSFGVEDLIKWGANYRPITIQGEWWRLLTSTFIHGGIMHLLANMYGLLFVGLFLEPLIGRFRFALAYILTGILASATSLWWHDATVSVGASGAIFGMYGVFLALLLTKLLPKEFSKAFLISTLIFVGFNLLIGIAGGIDNAAHIGGLLSGFVIGLIYFPGIKKIMDKKDILDLYEPHL